MKQEDLVRGRWYSGTGMERFVGGIGLWTGKTFIGYQLKFNGYLTTEMKFDEGMELEVVERKS